MDCKGVAGAVPSTVCGGCHFDLAPHFVVVAGRFVSAGCGWRQGHAGPEAITLSNDYLFVKEKFYAGFLGQVYCLALGFGGGVY
jgi:hypothetical protein